MNSFDIKEGLTFDDVLLLPDYSDVLPLEVNTATNFTRKIKLQIPLCSSAMDTVTEANLAIALAQQGGIGVIHKNLTIERQAEEVDKVKRSESGMIVDPVTIFPDRAVSAALGVMENYKISGVPVVDKEGVLVGIITNRDLRFETRYDIPVSEVMTPQPLVTVPVGTTLEDAKAVLQKHRIEKLLVVDETGHLKGLITVKDIQKAIKYPLAAKDELGRLRVAAAIGATGDFAERAAELVKMRVDCIVIDTAHGHSSRVIEAVQRIRSDFPDTQIVAGNIATGDAAKALIDAGVDAIKIGIGPGSICTTRVVTGAGVPQISAILECVAAAKEQNIPVIADGGVKFSGDVVKAIAAGADTVMIGSLFAGTEESPGETILYQGRTFKSYRGMGSIGAMKQGSKDRYSQEETISDQKLVPEGIEGRVAYKGTLADMVTQLVGGLRAGMGYTGCHNIGELQRKAKFIRITSAGLRESHVHDVIITKEASNYRLES
ncbi:MAG TPA: IMP dehydrogenase [Pyrinomonadaceae bacterium]|jgi:IMP dehydrogenase|nr:IMP dehydrogenase [Pyrinomonadaceae bacterium]